MKNVTSPGEMNIQCDSMAYGAIVIDGCVRYYKEYASNGRVVYTVYITEKQYNDYIKEAKKMKQISIDNGLTYVTPEEAIAGMRWEVIAHYMEDEAREAVHADLAPCSRLDFLVRYLEITDHDLIIG